MRRPRESGVTAGEDEFRSTLMIPAGAERVMTVCESTHWDPNWMLRSGEYDRLLVRRTIGRVIDQLLSEPRRVFGFESVFFPALYWMNHPEQRGVLRELVNDRRLVFSGCGVTTPDTLLPGDEMLLRDLLIGQEWLRSRGMAPEPRTLYLPDSFGHSPALPALLREAGVDNVAFHRIDGMYFAGGETDPPGSFPRPGSSAEHLRRTIGSDFIWRAPDGSRLLAHWLAHGYGHGDMIASRGLARTLQLPLSWSDRDPDRVAERIRRYADQLSDLARTPYLLLAMGHDFVDPVPDLVGLIDEWNDRHYDSTGLWLVNTSMEDYFSLVSFHRDRLEVVDLDPNPCWMGFYSSRPTLKQAARRLHHVLLTADEHAVRQTLADPLGTPQDTREPVTPHRAGQDGATQDGATQDGTTQDGATRDGTTGGPVGVHGDATRSEAWWVGVSSNHHDFITGTSPDRVANGEQLTAIDGALRSLRYDRGGRRPLLHGSVWSTDTRTSPGRFSRSGCIVTIQLDWGTATFDESRGGSLVDLVHRTGRRLVRGPALTLRSHVDSGGLWRLGSEFRGGRWGLRSTSDDRRAQVRVTQRPVQGTVIITIDTQLEHRPATIRATLSVTEPLMIVETTVDAPNGRTVTLAMPLTGAADSLEMHQPGGVVQRPLQRCHEPTYWPLHSFAHVLGTSGASGSHTTGTSLTVATASPTGLHVAADATVQVVVGRTAVKELAWGVVPILAPVWGRRWPVQNSTTAFEWPVEPVTRSSEPVAADARSLRGVALFDTVTTAAGSSVPRWPISIDDPLVETVAMKLADRGTGIMVRLRNWGDPSMRRTVGVRLSPGTDAVITRAWRTDARERDLREVQVHDGVVDLDLDHHLTTLRIHTSPI